MEAHSGGLLGDICNLPGSALGPYQKKGEKAFILKVSQVIHRAGIFGGTGQASSTTIP